jgi:hypothetical protein
MTSPYIRVLTFGPVDCRGCRNKSVHRRRRKPTSSVAIVAGMSSRVVPFRNNDRSSTAVNQARRLVPETSTAAGQGASGLKARPASIVRMPSVPLRASLEVAMQPIRSARRDEMSPHRAAARAGDLVLGGMLALVLLVACIAWETMFDAAVPKVQGALSGEPEVASPVRPTD